MADCPLREGEGNGASSAADGSHLADQEMSTRGRVAICDDEARLASLMAGLLRQHGYDACSVSSGADLVELLQGGRFDAVVLDVNLAGEDTAEVLRALQAEAEVPVILSSGYGEDDLAPELKAQPNVRGYLGKPYTADRLVDILRRVGALAEAPDVDVG